MIGRYRDSYDGRDGIDNVKFERNSAEWNRSNDTLRYSNEKMKEQTEKFLKRYSSYFKGMVNPDGYEVSENTKEKYSGFATLTEEQKNLLIFGIDAYIKYNGVKFASQKEFDDYYQWFDEAKGFYHSFLRNINIFETAYKYFDKFQKEAELYVPQYKEWEEKNNGENPTITKSHQVRKTEYVPVYSYGTGEYNGFGYDPDYGSKKYSHMESRNVVETEYTQHRNPRYITPPDNRSYRHAADVYIRYRDEMIQCINKCIKEAQDLIKKEKKQESYLQEDIDRILNKKTSNSFKK